MRSLPLDYRLLEQKIGYHFNNKNTLLVALTHSSYSNELKARNQSASSNERLEFLGDSVLSLVVSEYLYSEYFDCAEGELTRMRAEVVCERALSRIAKDIDLGDYILLGNGEERNRGRERKSILADAFEALVAALYVDAGRRGKQVVAAFLLPHIKEELKAVEAGVRGKDYKTILQQIVQQAEGEILEYVTVRETGPDHMKVFEVEAKLNSNVIGRGSGRSKREAEQNAAKIALSFFERS